MIGDLTFKVPETWTSSSDESWMEPTATHLRANVVYTKRVLERPTRTSDLATAFVARLEKANLPKLDVEDEREVTALAREQRVAQVSVTWDHPHGTIRQLVTLLARGTVAHTLTATIPKDDVARLDPTVSRALATLRLTDAGSLAFEAPTGWRHGFAQTSSAPNGAASVSLVKHVDAPPPTTARLDAEVALLANKLPGFQILSKRALAREGEPALGLLYVWTPADGRPREQQALVFWSHGAMWTFAAKATRDVFAEMRPLFARIAATVAPG